MRDKKNSVLFTKTECLVLSPDFKLLDESQVLLKVPRHNKMYSFDLNNVVPSGGLTCLFAKATIDESNLWHRRLGHINFKIINKLVKGNLVRGLPLKLFENDHTCVACQKRKQHKASCKTKLNQFCGMKGIKREFSIAKTPQQNEVAERKIRILIEAARTMLAISLLPTTFEAVNTACYVQNRVLVTKPLNKTPYELLLGAYSFHTPTSSYNIQEREVHAGFADEVIYSLFAKQSEDLDLLHEDLEQIDDIDIEEMDINWQIAMIAIRMKKFYKKTRREELD
ncbi:ribonuclease H-like domain-containing protein [Tanacetum coccineum]